MNQRQLEKAERYKGCLKWLEYLLGRALISLLSSLPISLAYYLGRGVGYVFWGVSSRRRRIVEKNLKVVNTWMEANSLNSSGVAGQSCKQVREVFMRNGANLFCGFTFSRMTSAQAEKHLQVEGFDHVTEALKQGAGVILLLGHMGPWEALAQISELAGRRGVEVPFGAMYRPLNNTYLDDWYRKQREARGTKLFSRRDGFRKPVDFIKAGGILGILSDQKMRQGVEVDFFGQSVKTSPIAGLFQRRTGASMICLSIETVGVTQWKIRIDPVDLSLLDEKKSRESFSRLCNHYLETALSRSPCDGFWFSRRF